MPSVRGNIHYHSSHWNVPSRETFDAENTSAGTTDATGRFRAQIERTHPPRRPLILIGEVRCLTVDGRFFQARGEITDVQHADSSFEIRGFIIAGYDSAKHSTEPDYFDVGYAAEPLLDGCVVPTTTEYMTPIHDGDIVRHGRALAARDLPVLRV
jgi:hypothetical protein